MLKTTTGNVTRHELLQGTSHVKNSCLERHTSRITEGNVTRQELLQGTSHIKNYCRKRHTSGTTTGKVAVKNSCRVICDICLHHSRQNAITLAHARLKNLCTLCNFPHLNFGANNWLAFGDTNHTDLQRIVARIYSYSSTEVWWVSVENGVKFKYKERLLLLLFLNCDLDVDRANSSCFRFLHVNSARVISLFFAGR